MAVRRYLPFGESRIDKTVDDFFKARGIDPKDIIGYEISRSVDDIGTITIKMFFEEEE